MDRTWLWIVVTALLAVRCGGGVDKRLPAQNADNVSPDDDMSSINDASLPDMGGADASGDTRLDPPDSGADGIGCVDGDGDGFDGQSADCPEGTDCDDGNPDINPGAAEVCENGADDDCVDGDAECAMECIDADGDGYGAAGSTGCVDDEGAPVTEVDCDDGDAERSPGSTEICDGKDNDCDTDVDECPLAGHACTGSGGTCQGGLEAECETADDCAGDDLTCDANRSPKTCRVVEGWLCQQPDDCLTGLTCEDGVCTDDFCSPDPCTSAPYDTCDPTTDGCVECPYFDPDTAVQDAECDSGEHCANGGWCAFLDPIEADSGANLDVTGPEELFWVSIWLADCWLNTRPAGDKAMCSTFDTTTAAITVTEADAESAFTNGDLDNALTTNETDALDDIWGVGLFDAKELEWRTDLPPGSERTYCVWYEPGGGLTGEALVLDECTNFVP